MNQPPVWKRNPLTEEMDRIAGANAALGTPIGNRGPIEAGSVGVSQEVVPLTFDQQREREVAYYNETGIAVGSLADDPSLDAKEVTIVPRGTVSTTVMETMTPIRPGRWIPVAGHPANIDFADMRGVDFSSKSLLVGGASIPLDDYSYEIIARAASNALQRSITMLAEQALKRLVPGQETVNEEMRKVPNGEVTDGIQSTPGPS